MPRAALADSFSREELENCGLHAVIDGGLREVLVIDRLKIATSAEVTLPAGPLAFAAAQNGLSNRAHDGTDAGAQGRTHGQEDRAELHPL